MAVRPRHPLLRNAIDACVKNVQEKAKVHTLAVAGPLLLQTEFQKMYGATLENTHDPSIGVLRFLTTKIVVVDANQKEVIHPHPIDKTKFQHLSTKPHYNAAKEYYADVFIPRYPIISNWTTSPTETGTIPHTLCMTYSKRAIPNLLKPIVDHNLSMSEGWDMECFHESTRRQFLQQYFGAKVLYAYDQLVPGAYRADLFRYGFLYERGGVYMDMNKKLLLPLKDISCSGYDLLLVRDLDSANVASSFIISKPRLPFWKEVVHAVVANVLTRFYGENSLDPTGPGLLRKVFDRYFNTTEGLPRQRGVHTMKGLRVMVWNLERDGDNMVIINENNQRVVDIAPLAPERRNKTMTDNTGVENYAVLYDRQQIYR
jgi:mannosyltransferase OCH1-like enzyme